MDVGCCGQTRMKLFAEITGHGQGNKTRLILLLLLLLLSFQLYKLLALGVCMTGQLLHFESFTSISNNPS